MTPEKQDEIAGRMLVRILCAVAIAALAFALRYLAAHQMHA